MYIKVIPICWQWQQSCSSERDALFSLVLQGNEYWAYEVSATVRWLTLSLEPNTSRTYMGLCTVHVTPYPHSHPPHLWLRTDEQMQYVGTVFHWNSRDELIRFSVSTQVCYVHAATNDDVLTNATKDTIWRDQRSHVGQLRTNYGLCTIVQDTK